MQVLLPPPLRDVPQVYPKHKLLLSVGSYISTFEPRAGVNIRFLEDVKVKLPDASDVKDDGFPLVFLITTDPVGIKFKFAYDVKLKFPDVILL